jgi:hypothetical protein
MSAKALLSSFLSMRSIRVHRSRVGWRAAPRYSRYIERCRREAPVKVQLDEAIGKAVELFRREGAASFWTERTGQVAKTIAARLAVREAAGEPIWSKSDQKAGTYLGDPWKDFPEFATLFENELGDFLKSYYGTHFKILYGTLYRTVHDASRVGSQLWHSDGGPGICVNVMFYLHDTTPAHGTLESLGWDSSLKIYEMEKAAERRGDLAKYPGDRRDKLCAFYGDVIEKSYKDKISQPDGKAGLVVPFLNNTLHRGGYPDSGITRTAIVFHCYPSHRPTNLDRYRESGISKTVPYPQDPAAEF